MILKKKPFLRPRIIEDFVKYLIANMETFENQAVMVINTCNENVSTVVFHNNECFVDDRLSVDAEEFDFAFLQIIGSGIYDKVLIQTLYIL